MGHSVGEPYVTEACLFKIILPYKVAVRKFSEKIGDTMFLMKFLLYVFSGPVHIWLFLMHISGQVLLELYLKYVEI